MLQTSIPAPEEAAPASESSTPEDFSIHGQFTNVTQYHPPFTSPFYGPNSLIPGHRGDETADLTLYPGLRLWNGLEAYVNPEVDQGFGLSDTLGIDVVMHTATLHKPHVATHSRQDFVDTNITGTLNLLEEATSVRAFLFTSTTSVFGRALTPPAGAPPAPY